MSDLGMRWVRKPGQDVEDYVLEPERPTVVVNTRTALWPDRWPAVALQACIDEIEAAAPDEQAEVKFNLPCDGCAMNTACLNAKAKELGSLMYSREILTNPRSAESSLFPRTLMSRSFVTDPLVPYWRPPFSREDEYAVCQGWDIAWSEKVGGDFLVCMSAYVHKPTRRRRLIDIERWQRKSFQQQVDLIEAKWKQYDADLVIIESDAAQRVWKQQVAETTAVPVMAHAAGQEKASLATGVPSLLIELENRRWEIPHRPGSLRFDEVENFLTELEAFGVVDGKLQGVGEHDDLVMAWWHLAWGIRRLCGEAGYSEEHRGLQEGKNL